LQTVSDDIILLAHGSGGGLSQELIRRIFVSHFDNPLLSRLEDASVFPAEGARLAFTTDSYVVKPLFFPGGDIGRLSVCGTVNDLSMVGAKPLYLSTGFILEEGLRVDDLERIVQSMSEAATEAGVKIICGDTKVVERRAADGVFINTAGIGFVRDDIQISVANSRPGDVVLVNGTIGDHGITIMSQREGLQFKSDVKSDAAPLNHLVDEMLGATTQIHSMRDPTRGGLATTLNEIAVSSHVGIEIDEGQIPVSEGVAWACEMLGLDFLYLANEGKLVATVASVDADRLLASMRENRLGVNATVIGKVTEDHPGRVVIKSPFGAKRIVSVLAGDQFPRIC
jgi:hydrogenase expression/formation protein HypE